MPANPKVIEEFLILNGPATQSEIAEQTQLSQATVSRFLNQLTTAGTIKAYSFDSKLYSAKKKPSSAQALMRTQLCAIARISAAYTIMQARLGQRETDAKFIEAMRNEMVRWSDVVNELEDRITPDEV